MSYNCYTKESWKGSVITCPVPPTLVTCGTVEKPNIFTVAWTGILNTQPPMTYISVRPERFSYDIIKSSGEFVINLATEQLVRAVDYCGVRSGRNTDKFKDTGLSVQQAGEVGCPVLEQSPVNIECRVREIIPLGTHDMFIADIVRVDVARELIDPNGRLELDKAGLLAYAHGEYFALGRKLGSFGYSVRKKRRKSDNKGKGKRKL
ncbi:flavin reductase family protein [Ruminococcus sp. Marseille-P6503]|uniref:flavin reductase family protein n=1 Tax=Ruminococcus sp. Marseille-P6503 TaxID=2364796 RepID=UPI000F54587B|nr:flavin reductase family protein [Ruminococcus sp. Marseille-P6503]